MVKDEEILKVLEEFSDYLQVGDIVNYVFRWIGWFIIQGLSLIVDGLEGVTDAILGLKGSLIHREYKSLLICYIHCSSFF